MHEQMASGHYGLIAGDQVFTGAVNDRSHTLLHRVVLQVYPLDAGEGFSLLRRPINHPHVVLIAYFSKVGVKTISSIATIELDFLVRAKRAAAVPIHQAVNHAVLV